MRTFIAVFPPPEVREALFRAARGLTNRGFRPTAPEKIHLTLKFLGEVAEEDLGRVARALEPVRERHEPFEVSTSSLGAFPSERRARILWAGVGEGWGPLRALALDVEELLEPVGFEREGRPYTPHLTIGRARGRPVRLESATEILPELRFAVPGIDLVRSVPGEGGVTYSGLETYPFRKR